MVRQQIDIDVEASKVKSETNRNNALRRYAMAGDGMRSYANPCEDQRLPAREKEENEEKRKAPLVPPLLSPHTPLLLPPIIPQKKKKQEKKESLVRVGRSMCAFEQFWQAYPKKVGKKDALKAFERAKPTAELFSKMLEAIEIAKKSPGWQRENGRFIPNPATWLNQGRWDDEPTTPSNAVADYSGWEDFTDLMVQGGGKT